MTGILVRNNHFILSGAMPKRSSGIGVGPALTRHSNWRGEEITPLSNEIDLKS